MYATGGFAGVYAISPGTGTSYGVYGTITGANNTGYGGYFSNTATTGWAGYFNGGKLQVTNATAFNPTTMPIDSVVVGSASANGCAGDGVYMSDTTTVGDGQGFIAYLGGSTYIGQLQNGNCYLGITFSNNGYIGIWNGGPSATLDIGLNGTTTGNIRLEGKTSGYVQIQTANAAGNATFQLPSSNGTSGFVLSTDGTGVTSWVSNAGTASTALSGITVAAAAHTINNVNWAQTWNWNSLTTQTAMTFASSSLTTGNIVTIQNTAAAVTSTGKVLNISDATTGSGYGVYSSMTGHGNTGYAGYFINTDTSATTTNYGVYGYVSTLASSTSSNSAGVYGEGDCGSCAGVTGVSANNAGVSGSGDPGVYASSAGDAIYANNYGTGTVYGVQSVMTGHGNTGYAGYFTNTDTSSSSNYGVYGITLSTGSQSSGLFGECDSVNCAGTVGISISGDGVYGSGGLAGIFGNGGTTTSIAVEGQQAIHGNTGYAGYFIKHRHEHQCELWRLCNRQWQQCQRDLCSWWLKRRLWPDLRHGRLYSIFQESGTGATRGVAAAATSTSGQGGFFTATATSGGTYGIYAVDYSAGGTAIFGYNLAGGTGIQGQVDGTANTSAAGSFINTGHGNTGYAGYFSNTDTSSNQNYGIYATVAGANANAGYFNGQLQANINGSTGTNVYPLIVSDTAATNGLGIGMILETQNDTDATNRNWSIGANITHGGDLEFASSSTEFWDSCRLDASNGNYLDRLCRHRDYSAGSCPAGWHRFRQRQPDADLCERFSVFRVRPTQFRRKLE